MTRRRDALLALAAGALLPAFLRAADRPYPDRPIRIVVTYPPGGQADSVGRSLASSLGQVLRDSVVVDNRPGGNAMIGAEFVAKAPADGYTLLLGGAANLTIGPAIYGEQYYDTLRDFATIGRVARVPQLLAVHANLPITTAQQLVAYAKQNPGKLTYASTAPANELALASLRAIEGIDIVSVSYKGTSQAMIDLIAGRLDLILADAASVTPHVRSGTLRVIANAGAERAREFENVPTMAEQGMPTFVWDSWQGLVAPKATPVDVLDRLQRAVKQVVISKEYRDGLERLGFLPIDEAPDRFSAVLQEEIARYKALITQLGKQSR